jgi:hypothetical protein
MKAQGEDSVELLLFTTSAVYGVSGKSHALAAIYPLEKDSGTHCTGGWVDPRPILDTEVREKFFPSAGDQTSIALSSGP